MDRCHSPDDQTQRFGDLQMLDKLLQACGGTVVGAVAANAAKKFIDNSTCAACDQIKWNVVYSWSCCNKDQCPSCAERTRSRKKCSVCGHDVN